MKNTTNEEMNKVFYEIEFAYVEQSIQQRKWINRSVMQKRDNSRLAEARRLQAENSLKREVKQIEERRQHNKIHTNKKSKKLAQVALKKKIKAVVDAYSQNGYLAFEHYLHVLYMLQITQNVGKLEDDYIISDRIKRVKEEKDSNELEFALQLWNKVNCYLFNYVDAVILVDFLLILLSNSNNKIRTAQSYIEEISQADDLPLEEIENNRERNADLVLESVWTVEQLFLFFKHKLNCPTIVTRTGFSIERGLKKNKLYTDYFKECTFRPKITKKAHEVEEKKEVMKKINKNLQVFEPDSHDLDSQCVSDKNSFIGSSQKLLHKKSPGSKSHQRSIKRVNSKLIL